MDDLISRQAAIDTMEDVDWYHINKDGQLVHGANSNMITVNEGRVDMWICNKYEQSQVIGGDST